MGTDAGDLRDASIEELLELATKFKTEKSSQEEHKSIQPSSRQADLNALAPTEEQLERLHGLLHSINAESRRLMY